MIAIHNNTKNHLFHYRWINYCESNAIPYKLVDCYANDIIDQLKDCNCLFFHYHQSYSKDIVMSKPLLYSLEQAGIKVFPDFNTAWHFDDKIGQKYLLEALKIDLVKTWVFYEKKKAVEWINENSFPKVFKLRGGAGSQNVQLVKSKEHAIRLTNKAFGNGFPAYDGWESFKERFRKWRIGKAEFKDVIKGTVRLFKHPRYAKVMGSEINYLYFQEFIADNDFDIRIIVIDGKAFALKRMVRKNDFRASGSGDFRYEREEFDERCVQLSFAYTKKMGAQCIAFDFVFDQMNNPKVVEISYGFANNVYDSCTGYWDEQMNWYEGQFNPYGWMVDLMIK